MAWAKWSMCEHRPLPRTSLREPKKRGYSRRGCVEGSVNDWNRKVDRLCSYSNLDHVWCHICIKVRFALRYASFLYTCRIETRHRDILFVPLHCLRFVHFCRRLSYTLWILLRLLERGYRSQSCLSKHPWGIWNFTFLVRAPIKVLLAFRPLGLRRDS